MRESDEIAQLHHLRLPGIFPGQGIQRLIHQQELLVLDGRGNPGFGQLHPFQVPAAFKAAMATSALHEDAAHGFGGGGKEMGPVFKIKWRKGGTILTNILLYTTSGSFTLYNVQTNVTATNGPGSYRVALTNAATTGAGIGSSLFALTVIPAQPPLVGPIQQGNQFTTSVATVLGVTYYLERKLSLTDTNWISVTNLPGNGLVQSLADLAATNSQSFYRVRVQ